MPFPKDTGYRTKRQMAKAAYRTSRPRAREAAYDRDGGRCIFPDCRRPVDLASEDPYRLANGHELRSRAQGGSPTDEANVVTTCFACHMGLHTPVGGKTARIDGTDIAALRFYRKVAHEWLEVTSG